MEFQNKINQLYYKHDEKAALNNVQEKMLTMEIIIIEHSNLFVKATLSHKEMHFARFRLKTEDKNFVSHEKLHRELGVDYI